MLHFKLTADLVPRGRTALDGCGDTRASAWTLENQRYREVVDRSPEVSAMAVDSVAYRDPRQLVDIGIITALSEL